MQAQVPTAVSSPTPTAVTAATQSWRGDERQGEAKVLQRQQRKANKAAETQTNNDATVKAARQARRAAAQQETRTDERTGEHRRLSVPGHFPHPILLHLLATSNATCAVNSDASAIETTSAVQKTLIDASALEPLHNEYLQGYYQRLIQRSSLNDKRPVLPLTKLLVITLVHDLDCMLSADTSFGTIRAVRSLKNNIAQRLQLRQPNQADGSIADRALNIPGDGCPAPDTYIALCFQHLTQRLANTTFTYEQSLQAVQEGKLMQGNTQQVLDGPSRHMLYDEPYVIGTDNVQWSAAVQQSNEEYLARQQRSWYVNNTDPFAAFRFNKPPSELQHVEKRQQCTVCNKQCHLYCPRCLVPAPDVPIPSTVQLPVQVVILYHAQESIKKSTSLQACVLTSSSTQAQLTGDAQCQLQLWEPTSNDLGQAQTMYNSDDTVVLYPSDDALFIDELSSTAAIDINRIKRLVVLECSWTKGNSMITHPALSHLPTVKLRQHESTYWRYQELGKEYLCTLEAIYHACTEIQQQQFKQQQQSADTASQSEQASTNADTSHFCDDLLYFYAHQHQVIRQIHAQGAVATEQTAPIPGGKKYKPPKTWLPPTALTSDGNLLANRSLHNQAEPTAAVQ